MYDLLFLLVIIKIWNKIFKKEENFFNVYKEWLIYF